MIMWFFMNTCYGFSLLTLVFLIVAFFQSFLKFNIGQANHVTFMVLTSIVYFFTQTLVIFFFVGTGVSIREYTQEHQMDAGFHRRSIAIKRRVYPPVLLNMLWLSVLFVIVGAVDTYRVPGWIYYAFFVFCIADYVRTKVKENACFRDNTDIILEMSGLKAKAT